MIKLLNIAGVKALHFLIKSWFCDANKVPIYVVPGVLIKLSILDDPQKCETWRNDVVSLLYIYI